MVLFEINVNRVLAVPAERKAPGAVHVNRIALWFTPQRMEIESW
jgi:hypothetical protein